MGAGLVTTHLVRFATMAVLARLLAPELFGLVGMALVTIQILGVLRQVGLFDAYVRRLYESPEDERRAADTVFIIMAILNASLFSVIFAAAPLAAGFFQRPELASVLRWLAVTLLFEAILTTPRAVLRKQLAYDALAQATILGNLANGAVAIGFALQGYGVWSLVAGQLALQLTTTVVLVARARWYPSWAFSTRHARDLFSHGKYLWGLAMVSAVGDSLDRILIGRTLGAAPLGVYQIAFNLARLPGVLISNLVNQVSFPVFSRLQRDPEALRRAFLKAVSHVALLAMPAAVCTAILSEDLVHTLYGARWAPAAPVVQVLAFYGMALAVSVSTGPVLQAIGRPQVLLCTSLVHNAMLGALLLSLGRFGVVAVAWAMLLPMLVSAAIAFGVVVRELAFPVQRLAEPLGRCALATLGMGAALGVLEGFIAELAASSAWPSLVSLVLSLVVAGLTYGLLTALVNRSLLVDVAGTLRRVLMGEASPA